MYTQVANLLSELNKINPHRGKAGALIWEIHVLASPLTVEGVDSIIKRLHELHNDTYGMKPYRQQLEQLLANAIEIKGLLVKDSE